LLPQHRIVNQAKKTATAKNGGVSIYNQIKIQTKENGKQMKIVKKIKIVSTIENNATASYLQQKAVRKWHGQRTRRNREQRKHFKVHHLARPFAVRGEIFRPSQFVRHRQRRQNLCQASKLSNK